MTGDPSAPAVLSPALSAALSVADAQPPPARASGTLVGVGMGPGDPDLVTVRAADLLAEADVVFVPVADPGGTGPTEQIALHYAEAWRVERLVIAPHGDERAWDAVAAAVASWFGEHPGGLAAFATVGDPCVYSAFTYLADAVRAVAGGVDVRIVPGITAMQDLAARAGTPLVQGREALQLFPVTAGAQRFREACERGDAVVAHDLGGMPPETLAVLRETGRFDDAVYDAGGPDPSTLLVPPARAGRGGPRRGR
ncbi:SAM-dependent methyltransferase [Pseudonocardia humida]|uniref:Precorrin-2 C(20)-methyltransferase n=1 Tax=Pseudonocardia humida TaxID=2800819 RepID=A0ABT0ZYY7_9PSEU|nr:precorrin-2 C(20)-methyltransferase [Pseudonocardia humida]MCO1655819.1 precorrin-2 C(20)-methyltransferase [Pseudonocardia humida]